MFARLTAAGGTAIESGAVLDTSDLFDNFDFESPEAIPWATFQDDGVGAFTDDGAVAKVSLHWNIDSLKQESFGASTTAPDSHPPGTVAPSFDSLCSSFEPDKALSPFTVPSASGTAVPPPPDFCAPAFTHQASVDPCPPPVPPAWSVACCPEGLPSCGSKLHSVGGCTPCKFFRGRRGCKDGERCDLCHLSHDDMSYSSIRKAMKQLAVRKRGQQGHETQESSKSVPLLLPASFRPPPGLEPPKSLVLSA